MDRKLFGTNDLIDNFIKSLDRVEMPDDGLSVRYFDRLTGKEWLEYCVDPERGFGFNLIQIKPRLTTEQLIEITFSSIYPDEVSAASFRLSIEEELEEKEFRMELFLILQQKASVLLSSKEITRLMTIIDSSGLRNSTNKRNILGKHYTEIDKDAQFFAMIAEQTKLLYSQFISQINARKLS